MDTILFLVIAYIGGTLGIKLKLPAGALLGSMFLVGILKMTETINFENISYFLRYFSKVSLGTMIGLMFTNNILKLSWKQLLGLFLVGLSSVLSALIIALSFNLFEVLPFVTALVSSAPGGIPEMLTLADSIGINTEEVIIIHLIRFVTLMILLKWLLTINKKKENSV